MAITPQPPQRTLLPAIRDFVRSVRFRPAWMDAAGDLTWPQAQRDILSGLVVGVVALPLAVAFAIASGADPRAGLIAAALGGMLVAVFGGSRVQVAGPTGAFVVILYGVSQGYGLDKLFVATAMAGALLLIFGLLRLGTLIKYIPYPVTTGFTAGIAIIILLGQLPTLLGLRLAEVGVSLPAHSVGKIEVVAAHLGRTSLWAVAFAVATVTILLAFRRWVPRVPGPAVALAGLTLAALLLPLANLERVGDLYVIRAGAPEFRMPAFTPAVMAEMFPAALTIALLGAIESLLSAVVADGMTGTRHNSNQELMGQGIANLVVPLFGGIAVTGAIARTATNVQNGARSPLAALTHGLLVLLVLLVAAPLAAHVPMAVLGGILAVVAWNMSERHRIAQLLRMPAPDALVMLATLALTVLTDLTVAVLVGMLLAAFLFIARMSRLTRVGVGDPEADSVHRQDTLEGRRIPDGVVLYSIDGPFFFGAAETFQDVIERLGTGPRVVVFRMRRVPYMDATGLNAMTLAVQQLRRRGIQAVLSAPQNQPLYIMMRSGFLRLIGDENVQPNIEHALARCEELVGGRPDVPADPAGMPPA